jgi:hypothetical protein
MLFFCFQICRNCNYIHEVLSLDKEELYMTTGMVLLVYIRLFCMHMKKFQFLSVLQIKIWSLFHSLGIDFEFWGMG